MDTDNRQLLRFTTAGSVDDGKSTLTGRLLFATGNIKDDILESITDNNNELNLAHVTDGLRAEREQGITIDVAYKYFDTSNRKYIITDAPGHFQYTRNLVTGASTVDVMIILVDAVNGITAQTRRHAQVAAFLRKKHIVLAVNKMDSCAFDRDVFMGIKKEFDNLLPALNLQHITYIPISALCGDNVVSASDAMQWYTGPTLLDYLEGCPLELVRNKPGLRFCVQYVLPNGGLAGQLLSGSMSVGDAVVPTPPGDTERITRIYSGYKEITKTEEPGNFCIFLDGTTRAQRGDLLVNADTHILTGNTLLVDMCWLDDASPALVGKEYILRVHYKEIICTLAEIQYYVNSETFLPESTQRLEVNEFARVVLQTRSELAYDKYIECPENGRCVLIDTFTNNTCAALVIVG